MKRWVSECDAQKNFSTTTHSVQLNCPVPLLPALSGLIKLAYICVSPQRGEQQNPPTLRRHLNVHFYEQTGLTSWKDVDD